ncbi:MAG: hypothetical protein R2769_15195 [Saprospiraceae bacterium]
MYQEVFDTVEQLDAYIVHLSEKLIASNPAAMRQLKEVFWTGTENWDQLLEERAAMSGELVLSTFTRSYSKI